MSVEYMFDFVIIRHSPHFAEDELEKKSSSYINVNGVEISLGQLICQSLSQLCTYLTFSVMYSSIKRRLWIVIKPLHML